VDLSFRLRDLTRFMTALTPYHGTLLMTLYATGVRRAEPARLRVSHIDSKQMVIHVQGGKITRAESLGPGLPYCIRVEAS
jgi:integrase